MNYPAKRVMQTLAALAAGQEFIIIEDERGFVELAPLLMWEVHNDELDELKRRGWLVVAEDGSGLQVSESGRYWSERWLWKTERVKA